VRRLGVLLVPALAAGALTGCAKHQAVHVGFRPQAGASYRYEIKVQSATVTTLGDGAPERSTDDVTLQSVETVLSAAPDEVRVQVQLHREGSPDRTFTVRFDRGAQLAGVDSVDGLPPDVLGPGGFPEFLPAAATAPPDRALSAGEKWKIDANPTLPGAGAVHLQGTGRLVKVVTSGGRKVASIKAETSLPLSGTTKVGDSTVTLSGTERTESTASRAVTDGVVDDATAVTRATYGVVVSPPTAGGPEVRGTMVVEIRSQTRRLPDVVETAQPR
jgi:hypothetical protein